MEFRRQRGHDVEGDDGRRNQERSVLAREDRRTVISRRDAETQRMTENEIGTVIVDSAIALHRALGPGLLESVYEITLAHELNQRGLRVERQVPIAIEYRGIKFDEGFRADIIVESRIIIELK